MGKKGTKMPSPMLTATLLALSTTAQEIQTTNSFDAWGVYVLAGASIVVVLLATLLLLTRMANRKYVRYVIGYINLIAGTHGCRAKNLAALIVRINEKSLEVARVVCEQDVEQFRDASSRLDSVLHEMQSSKRMLLDLLEKSGAYTLKDCENAFQACAKLVENADRITDISEEAEKQIDELLELARDAQAQINATEQEIALCNSRISQVEETGIWVAEARASISSAVMALANATLAAGAKQIRRTYELLSQAKTLASEAAEIAENAQRERGNLITRHLSLQGELGRVEEQLGIVVDDNKSEARQALARAKNELDAAQTLFSLGSQKWEEARKRLDVAQDELGRANTLARTGTQQ
jgi:hypothetical protein